MDELEHDARQMSLTDRVLEDKFAPKESAVLMTPMQARMAKARATRDRNREARKAEDAQKALTGNTTPAKMVELSEVKLYSDALLTFIQLRNPKSQAEFDAIKLLADDVVSHVKSKYSL